MISYLRTNATFRARVAELEGVLDAAEREADELRRRLEIERESRVEYRAKWVDVCCQNNRLRKLLDSAVVRGPGGRFVKC
jgi:hypothetical protein